jgi:TATA-box binding protein (TBP) (component of TFIID and TFIIIB)
MKKKIKNSGRQTITMKIAVGTMEMKQKFEITVQNICKTEGLKSQHRELNPIRLLQSIDMEIIVQ